MNVIAQSQEASSVVTSTLDGGHVFPCVQTFLDTNIRNVHNVFMFPVAEHFSTLCLQSSINHQSMIRRQNTKLY